MTTSEDTKDDRDFDKRVMQVALRLSLLALLVFWCLRILGPFINPILRGRRNPELIVDPDALGYRRLAWGPR